MVKSYETQQSFFIVEFGTFKIDSSEIIITGMVDNWSDTVLLFTSRYEFTDKHSCPDGGAYRIATAPVENDMHQSEEVYFCTT